MDKLIKQVKTIQNKTKVWFDGRNLKNEASVLPLVYNLRFEYLVIKLSDYQRIKPPHKMKLVIEVNSETINEINIKQFPKEVIFMSGEPNFLKQVADQGYNTALYKRVENQEDMELAWKIGNQFNFVIVELVDPTNIPLELIIARLQNRKTILLKLVNTLQDAEIAFGVMEAGSDGVVLQSEDIPEILEVDKFMGKDELGKLEIVKAKVIEVQHIGMGYRACIDTTNILQKNEGMIIGSTSNGGLLVSSETHFLPYMELRPFRVNAGAVHSYVWAPDGLTNYLTELKAGSKVLCIDTEGNTREVSVGRIKIEMRPLLKIEVAFNEIHINTIVQDDWHIRIFGENGEPRNASTIQVGDLLLAYLCHGGRHVGVKISESLEEK